MNQMDHSVCRERYSSRQREGDFFFSSLLVKQSEYEKGSVDLFWKLYSYKNVVHHKRKLDKRPLAFVTIHAPNFGCNS